MSRGVSVNTTGVALTALYIRNDIIVYFFIAQVWAVWSQTKTVKTW